MHIRSSFTQSDDEKWKRWVRGAWNRRKIEERESERISRREIRSEWVI